MSCGDILLSMVIEPYTPSIITKGSLPPDSELRPRRRTVGSALTLPPFFEITRPATFPLIAAIGLST